MKKFVAYGPYVFHSKKHEGQFLEDLFFQEFSFILWLKERKISLCYTLGQHLEFLLQASKNVETKMICPLCGQNPVKFFYVLERDIVSPKDFCCDARDCRQKMAKKYYYGVEFPINFDSLIKLQKKSLINKASRVFKKAFGLPRQLKEGVTYDFFRAAYHQDDSPQKIEKKIKANPKSSQLELF